MDTKLKDQAVKLQKIINVPCIMAVSIEYIEVDSKPFRHEKKDSEYAKVFFL